jgi:hypothetical protein
LLLLFLFLEQRCSSDCPAAFFNTENFFSGAHMPTEEMLPVMIGRELMTEGYTDSVKAEWGEELRG